MGLLDQILDLIKFYPQVFFSGTRNVPSSASQLLRARTDVV